MPKQCEKSTLPSSKTIREIRRQITCETTGASRCPPCAERSYHGSAHFKGVPVWEPQYTVIEIETGIDHGTYDSMADVALCLAFAKLDRDRVEIVTDAPITASCTAWE